LRVIIFVIIIFFLSGCQSEKSTNEVNPLAEKGVVDLSQWDFDTKGKIYLDGEWEFYWQQLLTPRDFASNTNKNQDWIQVPNAWNDQLDKNNKPFPAFGYSTFRLKIIVPPQQKKLSIRLSDLRDAYKLWVNQELLIESGVVGKNKENTISRIDSKMTTFPLVNGQVEIVLQIANYRSDKSGFIRGGVLLGKEEVIQKTHVNSIAVTLFLCGCYLIIGLYHLLFYQMRRKNQGAFYFGILCVLIFIRVLTTGDKLLIYWTNIPTFVNSKLAYLSVYAALPIFFIYLKSIFPKEIKQQFVKVVLRFAGLLCLFIFLAPNTISHYTFYPFRVLLLFCTLYVVYAMYFVLRRKKNGGVLFTIGILIAVATAWNDTIYESGDNTSGFLFPFGILAFMLLQTSFLAKVFADNIVRIRLLSETFKKFVPEQFLRRLDEEDSNEIELGVAREELLTISFSDIRSFSEISEQMTSQELLVFLNEFFERMDDPIHDNHGFIDKYIGDSIMSVFDRKEDDNNKHASDSVRAAIGMHQINYDFFQNRKLEIPIRFGIGIHTGRVILGTVGSAKRMDSTVIGDSVNLASRLESLTKYYDAQIIISESTRNLIHSDDFYIRQIDKVVVKGKSNIVAVYEIFDANPFEIKKMKVESLPDFNQGLNFYFDKKWDDAIRCFQKSLKIYSEDKVAKMYIERCEALRLSPPEDGWQGEFIYKNK